MLVARKIDACNTSHTFLTLPASFRLLRASRRELAATRFSSKLVTSLTLTLFVFRVLADHPHYSLAVDDLALITNFLDRCSYLHNPVLSSQLPVLSNCNCVFFQILRF